MPVRWRLAINCRSPSSVPKPSNPSVVPCLHPTARYRLPDAHWRPATGSALRAYFHSGWAFLIPYLFTYLLYYWQKWPANPPTGHYSFATLLSPPALLHVYWVLHAIHAILAVVALRSWWHDARREEQTVKREKSAGSQPAASLLPPTVDRPVSTGISLSAFSFQLSSFAPVLRAVLPWLFLTLVFAIPGVYLEWPADPWEHLRRIMEWKIHPLVGNHSAGYKSFYFFAYSWVGWLSPAHLFFWLNVYYVWICLLLAWQYYLLAEAVCLDRRWAFLFIITNVLTFGNACFSFYRYYGLSTSIYTQLGAVALTRMVLEWAEVDRRQAKHSKPLRARRLLITALQAPLGDGISLWIFRLTLCALLLAVIAFNHVQGLGIVGLGVVSILAWRFVQWKRSALWWLLAVTLALSIAAILWWPRHASIDAVYRPGSWLNAWYGFDFFSPHSAATGRAMEILGIFGVLNLVAGIWLLCRNHIVGWLTVGPVIGLSLPFITLPLVNALDARSTIEINTYSRILFSLPACLALAYITFCNVKNSGASRTGSAWSFARICGRSRFALMCAIVAALVAIPGYSPAYNRFWHSIEITPDDLQLRHLTKLWSPENRIQVGHADTLTIGHPLVSEIKWIFQPDRYRNSSRLADASVPISELTQQLDLFDAVFSNFDRPSTHQNTPRPDQLLFHGRESYRPTARIVSNPTSTSAPWITLGGAAPQEVLLAPHRLIIRNPIGSVSYPFSSELIPISRYHRYQLTCEIRQSGAPDAINYLAVAWYDKSANLLTSNLPFPQGAGRPAGWNNGTFSYFGLIGRPAAADWTSYSISFGLGEAATIPANAAFLRIGAMLNFNGEAKASVELTDARLVENDLQHQLLLSAPSFRHLYTPASLAAKLSGHWTPQYVPAVHVGITEMRAHF